jgi:hypothetical protein
MSRDDYIEVSDRIIEFRAKYPDGCLRPADLSTPYRIERIGEQTFVVVVAAAYRSPDDTNPGIGMAWEPCPGRTAFTRLSELQNCETSAWGRALVAVGAADARRGIASADEVRNRSRDAQVSGNHSPDSNESPAEPRMITRPMVTRLQILLTEAGIKDRGEKLAYCENLAQRPLSSSNDLTMAEGKLIMDTLVEAAQDTHQGNPDAV